MNMLYQFREYPKYGLSIIFLVQKESEAYASDVFQLSVLHTIISLYV